MEKQLPFLCVGYIPQDPKQGGSSSHSCEGCLAWSPIVLNRPFILEDKTVNCYNFLEVKKLISADVNAALRRWQE
jgi:hypothetical protein